MGKTPASLTVTDVGVHPSSGDVVVVGQENDGATSFLVEFGVTGAELSRREFLAAPGHAYTMALELGANGAYHLGGMFQTNLTIGTQTFTEKDGFAGFLARVIPSGTGDTSQAYVYKGMLDQDIIDLARFQSGIVAAGTLRSTVNLHNQSLLADSEGDALLSVEFNGATVPHAVLEGPGTQSFRGVTTDKVGLITAVGESPSIPQLEVVGSPGSQLAIVARYDSSLSTRLWAVGIGSALNDAFSAVAADPADSGDVVAVGWAKGPVDVGAANPLPHEGGDDILVARFDSAGGLKWARTFGGAANDRAYGVGIAAGDIFVVGDTTSASLDFGTGVKTKYGPRDGYVLRLSGDGQPLWAELVGGPGEDFWGALTVDQGRVLVAGRFSGSITLLGETLVSTSTSANEYDIGVIMLEP